MLLKDFIGFLRKPRDLVDSGRFKEIDLWLFIKVAFICFIVVALANVPKTVLQSFEWYSPPKGSNLFVSDITVYDKVIYLVMGIICIPFIEEYTYRLFLSSYKKSFFIVSIALILGTLITWLLMYKNVIIPLFVLPFHLNSIWVIVITQFSKVLIAFSFWCFLRRVKLNQIEGVFRRKFGIFIYLSASIFALMHSWGLGLQWDNMLTTIVILMPLFILGLFLTYVRIRLGLLYGVLLHSLFNVLPFFQSVMSI